MFRPPVLSTLYQYLIYFSLHSAHNSILGGRTFLQNIHHNLSDYTAHSRRHEHKLNLSAACLMPPNVVRAEIPGSCLPRQGRYLQWLGDRKDYGRQKGSLIHGQGGEASILHIWKKFIFDIDKDINQWAEQTAHIHDWESNSWPSEWKPRLLTQEHQK